MEYKRLTALDNQYPNISSYKAGTTANTDILYGIYADINKIDYKIPDISDLKWTKGTKFRFILVIRKTDSDPNPVLYTSEAYYADLQGSINENNPYFGLASFNQAYVVNITYDNILQTFLTMQALEKKDGVVINTNVFVNKDSTIDYDSLVTYIDWLVAKVDPLDIDTGGVLAPQIIANWNYLAIDPITQVVSNKLLNLPSSDITIVSDNTGLTAYGKAQLDAANQHENISLQYKLNAIQKEITELQNEINTKSHYKFESLLNIFVKASVSIADNVYISKIGSKNYAIKDLTDKLISKLNSLKSQITQLESSIQQSSATTNTQSNVVSTIGNQAGLVGNIPTSLPFNIPTKLPTIPKLPGSLSDLAPLLPLLTVPKLPKIPEVPKMPSLKLPPVPKFKPKVPKVPKKFKKGLAGLKDDVNTSKGTLTAAQSTGVGIVASAQSKAMQTTGNLNKGLQTTTTQLANGAKLRTNTITSGFLGKGETEASVLADIAAYIKQ